MNNNYWGLRPLWTSLCALDEWWCTSCKLAVFRMWDRSWVKHQTKLAMTGPKWRLILNHNLTLSDYFESIKNLPLENLYKLKINAELGPKWSTQGHIEISTFLCMYTQSLTWVIALMIGLRVQLLLGQLFFKVKLLPKKYQGRSQPVSLSNLQASCCVQAGLNHTTRCQGYNVLYFDVPSDTFYYQHFWGICSSDKCFQTGKQFSTLQRWVCLFYLFILY